MRVRTKAPLPREVERYTIERCCLQAKLMPSHNKGASDATEGDDDGDEDEVDNGEV